MEYVEKGESGNTQQRSHGGYGHWMKRRWGGDAKMKKLGESDIKCYKGNKTGDLTNRKVVRLRSHVEDKVILNWRIRKGEGRGVIKSCGGEVQVSRPDSAAKNRAILTPKGRISNCTSPVFFFFFQLILSWMGACSSHSFSEWHKRMKKHPSTIYIVEQGFCSTM